MRIVLLVLSPNLSRVLAHLLTAFQNFATTAYSPSHFCVWRWHCFTSLKLLGSVVFTGFSSRRCTSCLATACKLQTSSLFWAHAPEADKECTSKVSQMLPTQQ